MLKLNPLVFDGSPMELMRDTFVSMGDKMPNVSGVFREECDVEKKVNRFFIGRPSPEKIILYLHGRGM